jgi:Arc/MetJ-type ribon-helix-helix transcriptional regulator
MSTLSVPLNDDLLRRLKELVDSGAASSKADAMRKALELYLEKQAIDAVLEAEREPNLDGDLRELANKFK